MSAKTRIVVLHMKKLVFAGVITGLGILLACALHNRKEKKMSAISYS